MPPFFWKSCPADSAMKGMEQHISTAVQRFTTGCRYPHAKRLSPYFYPSATTQCMVCIYADLLWVHNTHCRTMSEKAHYPAWQPQPQGIKKMHVLHTAIPFISPLGHFSLSRLNRSIFLTASFSWNRKEDAQCSKPHKELQVSVPKHLSIYTYKH